MRTKTLTLRIDETTEANINLLRNEMSINISEFVRSVINKKAHEILSKVEE